MSKDSELLTSVSKTSTDSEFFSPIPPGYKPGRTKYLFVMGTVISGLGASRQSSHLVLRSGNYFMLCPTVSSFSRSHYV